MYEYMGGRERGTSTPQARPTAAGEHFEFRIVTVRYWTAVRRFHTAREMIRIRMSRTVWGSV